MIPQDTNCTTAVRYLSQQRSEYDKWHPIALQVHRNGDHQGYGVTVSASTLSDFLGHSNVHQLLNGRAARKLFCHRGKEIQTDKDLLSLTSGDTVYVDTSEGPKYNLYVFRDHTLCLYSNFQIFVFALLVGRFKDPLASSLSNAGSIKSRNAWSIHGVELEAGKKKLEYVHATRPTSEDSSKPRTRVYANGDGISHHWVLVGDRLQFLDDCTHVLSLSPRAKRIFDLDGNEILHETRDVKLCPLPLQVIYGRIAGPLWISTGKRLDNAGQLKFLEKTLADVQHKLNEAHGGAASHGLQNTWTHGGVDDSHRASPKRRTQLSTKKSQEYIEKLDAARQECHARIRELYRLNETRRCSQGQRAQQQGDVDNPDLPIRQERRARLESAGKNLVLTVVENGRDDTSLNQHVVIFDVVKAQRATDGQITLLHRLLEECTAKVNPSRGDGKKLFYRHEISVNKFETKEMHDVYDFVANAANKDLPTFFLSCGEPFIEAENKTVALALQALDALNTSDAGKVLVETSCDADVRPQLAHSKKTQSSVSVFANMHDVPETMFRTGSVSGVDHAVAPEHPCMCISTRGPRAETHQLFAPVLQRHAVADHQHSTGNGKRVLPWQQWTIDRKGARAPQGQDVSDHAAYIANRLCPGLVLTESVNPCGLGFRVTFAKRQPRDPKQLWTFNTDGTIAPLSTPTKYLTYHEPHAAVSSSAYVNVDARVSIHTSSTLQNAVHLSVHAVAPLASNTLPEECTSHILAMMHTCDAAASIMAKLRECTEAMVKKCHDTGITDVQLATYNATHFQQCGLSPTDEWQKNIRQHLRPGSGINFLAPCESLLRYLNTLEDTLPTTECHRIEVVFLAAGSTPQRPNQSWFDLMAERIARLEHKHILVTIRVIAFAQGCQMDFVSRLARVTGTRGSVDYLSADADNSSDGPWQHNPADQLQRCLRRISDVFIRDHRVPFLPITLALAEGSPSGHPVSVIARCTEDPSDRDKRGKFRYQLTFTGNVLTTLASSDTVSVLRDQLDESILTHRDGRLPSGTVTWVMGGATADNSTIDAMHAVLAHVRHDMCRWLDAVLEAEDTFQHSRGSDVPVFTALLAGVRDTLAPCIAMGIHEGHVSLTVPAGAHHLSTIRTTDPTTLTPDASTTASIELTETSTDAGPAHTGSTFATPQDLDAVREELERLQAACTALATLTTMHVVEDRTRETLGRALTLARGVTPGVRMLARCPRPLLFDHTARYAVRADGSHGAPGGDEEAETGGRQLGLVGNSAAMQEVGADGVLLPWQFAPVLDRPGCYHVRTCWREEDQERRVGSSLGVSNGSLQLFPLADIKHLALWEVVVVDVRRKTFALRYRAPVAGVGSDGLHVTFNNHGRVQLSGSHVPMVQWRIERIDAEADGSSGATSDANLRHVVRQWANADVGNVQALIGQRMATASVVSMFEFETFVRQANLSPIPEDHHESFATAFRTAECGAGQVHCALIIASLQCLLVGMVLHRAVTALPIAYDSILNEMPHLFHCSSSGLIRHAAFIHGVGELNCGLGKSDVDIITTAMGTAASSMLNYAVFERGWDVAQSIAEQAAESAAALGMDGQDAGADDVIDPTTSDVVDPSTNDVILSTQPKARRDRPSRSQRTCGCRTCTSEASHRGCFMCSNVCETIV